MPGPGDQASGPIILSADEEPDNLRVAEAESRATGRCRKNNRMWFRVALSLVCLAAPASRSEGKTWRLDVNLRPESVTLQQAGVWRRDEVAVHTIARRGKTP
jgi:hypothetical protein